MFTAIKIKNVDMEHNSWSVKDLKRVTEVTNEGQRLTGSEEGENHGKAQKLMEKYHMSFLLITEMIKIFCIY